MKNTIISGGVTLALLSAGQAAAGGIWLNEYGDFSGGRASAGAAAGTDEAATIIQNPASAGRLESSEIFVSAGALIPTNEFEIDQSEAFFGDKNGGDAGVVAPGATMAYVHDTGSDKYGIGIYMAGLAGSGLNYSNDWVGRFQVTEVELLLIALAPAFSYNITDKLAVGVAPQLIYARLDMDLNLPNIVNIGGPDLRAELDGDDTGFGFTAGVTYEFDDATRIGINYQSALEPDFDGDLTLKSGNPSVSERLRAKTDTELTAAQTIRIGLHHALTDGFALDFTVGWDDWSALDSVLVSVDDVGSSGLEKNWSDTYHYAAGFQYAVDDTWDLTAGVAYDTNPVDATDRTADLPVDRQIRYNVGVRKALSKKLTTGGYINYTDLGSAEIKTDFWEGDYRSNYYYSVSAYMRWTF